MMDVLKITFCLQVRETLRDSVTGEESMKIGHHVDDRGHVIEKRRRNGGQIEERNQYIGISEGTTVIFESLY